ncbi:MAG TPA: hypothetical protein VE870_12755 [Bacteroidales bacterium]|nr:hypothetical protein [Bacteroidales bacterium]
MMQPEPTPLSELLGLILFLGSVTFIAGTLFQIIILIKNRKSILSIFAVVTITRLMTITGSFFIWAYWPFTFDTMFLFVFLPAVLPEMIFSPLLIKIVGKAQSQREISGR